MVPLQIDMAHPMVASKTQASRHPANESCRALATRDGQHACPAAPSKPASLGSHPPQYSSCRRTQLMVPALSLRPLGTRSSQLSAPISSSAPR
jgi:hypothetical protein